MRLSDEIRYDADPAVVFAMICDPRFQERKCVANGSTEHEVGIEPDAGGGAVVTTRRTLPTDGVPDFVKAFVGETLRVSQLDQWGPPGVDGAREGATVVEIDGAPVRFSAVLRLLPAPGGSVQQVEGELKASVPLLGGRVEKAAEPAIRAAVRAEQRTATAWLTTG